MKIRTALRLLIAAMLSVVLAVPMAASADARHRLVDQIDLPTGFQPEGITIGPGPFAYFGSRLNGAIYAADLRTGQGNVINAGATGTQSIGLKSDQEDLLYVAGGGGGNGRVYSLRTGAELATYDFTDNTSFVNDVVLTKRSAWFTDSQQAQLYRVPLGRNGQPADEDSDSTLPLTGDWDQGTGFGANGITQTPDDRALLVINSTSGVLYRVDPSTGRARKVDLGGYLLTNGDGMLLLGRTLYVVRNRLNLVAVIKLDKRGSSGRLVDELTSPPPSDGFDGFDVPTTVAAYKDSLFLPNARFGSDQTGAFWVTRIDR